MSSLPAPNRAWSGVAAALRIVFVVMVAALALSVVVDVWRWRMSSSWIADHSTISLSAARSSDSWAALTGYVCLLLSLATIVLFIIWLYQAHASRAMNRDYMEHASGWAIGGWFVPVMNLFRPFQVVQDVRRGSAAQFHNPQVIGLTWWLLLVGGEFFNRVASFMSRTPAPKKAKDALASFHDYVVVSTIADALLLGAAAAGAVLVTVVTREVLARHAAVSAPPAPAAPPPPAAEPPPASTLPAAPTP